MRKIHARLSVEIEVSDKEFEEIVEEAKLESDSDGCEDVPLSLFHDLLGRAKPCDWDDEGYIPGPWLEEDIKYPKGYILDIYNEEVEE